VPKTRSEKSRKAVLAALALGTFFVGWDSLVTVPLLPAITRETGVSADLGVLLVTAYALAYLLSAPLFGAISDRVGRRSMILAGMMVLGIGTILTGFGSSLTALLVFRALTGVGAGMVEPGVYALIGDRFSYGQRGRAVGLVTGTLIASTLFGVPLGGYLAELSSWRFTFWLIGGLAILAIAAVYAGLPQDRPAEQAAGETPDLPSTPGRFRAAISTPSVSFALLATFLWFGGLQGTFANIGLYYTLNFGFGVAQNGLMLMVAGLASVAGSVVGGRLSDAFGKRAVVSASSVLAATCVLVLTSIAAQNLLAAITAHVLWAAAFASGQAALTALISELNPKARGTVLALNTSSMFAGSMVFTGASAALLRAGGFSLLGLLSAVAALLVLPLALYLVKEPAAGTGCP
jgi:predicted MFS family arabinose efflux permease